MDRRILQRTKSGDEQAFELLFRRYYVRLCSFANRFICSTAEAEEIVQDVFLNLWGKRDQLNLDDEISSYLFRSVRNSCFNLIEHRKVADSYYAVIAQAYRHSSEGVDSGDPVQYAELQQKVEGAIGSLPAECRRIFRMSRMEGLKYTEIAAKLNISVKTVETQISRALAKLKTELKDFLMIMIIYLF